MNDRSLTGLPMLHVEEMESFPPKNREGITLGPLEIYIEDGAERWAFDPNGLIDVCLRGAVPDASKPAGSSCLSGQPGLHYRSADLSMILTPGELYRLIMLCLTPEEYFALRDRYGIFQEIHSDHYDPETGEALQPKA